MSDDGSGLSWSDEQWTDVQQLVHAAARKARVASTFLPLQGPLPPGQSTVPALAMENANLVDPQRGEAVERPDRSSLVLPSDRITPFLEGPLLRSSTVPDHQGVVVALAGSPVDLVVGTDIGASFVQRSLEPRHVLRVAERFVLRLKQPSAVCQLKAK